ncbi:MAG: ATP synthase subunit I [Gorillibacterium sp.]|nr:ATP synthase subunit I [Gorillibacterium sp.]
MDDMAGLLRKVFRYALWFMLICALTGVVFPTLRPLAVGLILGTAVSVINAWTLERRTEKFIQQILINKRKRMSLGFSMRVLIVLIATMIAYKVPTVDLIGMAIGLVFVPLTNVVTGIITGLRKY